MRRLSELFGISERDIIIFMAIAFSSGFAIGVITVAEIMHFITGK